MDGIYGTDKREEKRRDWDRHVEAWARSNQSQAAYCRDHGLNYGLFAYSKRRLKQRVPTGVKLVPISMSPTLMHGGARTATPLMRNIDDRYRVEVKADFDAVTLRRLIAVLEQA